MNKEEIKILSYLSDRLGNGGNILSMSEGIGKKYGSAYYPNIYNTIIKLEKKGIISIVPDGNNRLIRLAMKNPFSIYYISEAESRKTINIDMPRGIIDALLDLALDSDIIAICALKYEEYIKINRIELLIIARSHDQRSRLISALLGIESMHNAKIDPIILIPQELSDMLEGSEFNKIKDLIKDRSILYNSEGFWEIIRKYKIDEKYKNSSRFPEELNRAQLAYNYNRFGYALYENTEPDREIALEDTMFLMAKSKEVRIRYGALILLHKNSGKINLSYLYYLFKRHDGLSALKGMLESLKAFYSKEDGLKVEMFMETIPDKQQEAYDKKLIKKYIAQYS